MGPGRCLPDPGLDQTAKQPVGGTAWRLERGGTNLAGAFNPHLARIESWRARERGRTMGFKEAITYCFQNYVGFSGRAARSEYWYWVLFVVLLSIVAWLIDMTVFGFNTSGVNPISVIVTLATRLPGLAVWVRRLHGVALAD